MHHADILACQGSGVNRKDGGRIFRRIPVGAAIYFWNRTVPLQATPNISGVRQLVQN
jgi:hypothetical protein